PELALYEIGRTRQRLNGEPVETGGGARRRLGQTRTRTFVPTRPALEALLLSPRPPIPKDRLPAANLPDWGQGHAAAVRAASEEARVRRAGRAAVRREAPKISRPWRCRRRREESTRRPWSSRRWRRG